MSSNLSCSSSGAEEIELQFESAVVVTKANVNTSIFNGFEVQKMYPSEFFCGDSVSVTVVGTWAIEESVFECLLGQARFQVHSVRSNGQISTALVCDINQQTPGNWSLFVRSQQSLHLAGRVEFKLAVLGLRLSQGLGRLLATTEAYPDLKSNTNFLALQSQLEGTENRINISIKDYNEAVQSYNTTIRTFPDAVGAKLFYGAKPMTPYQATAPNADRAPQVKF